MRRSNEKSRVSGFNAGRGITGQTLLYQHMSNHYRRLLNAKKSIDTAPPTTFKTKVNSSSSVVSSSVRNYSAVNRKFISGNFSPALTDRSVSTYSNGDSYCRSDAYCGGKCQNFRDNECNWGAGLEINPASTEMELMNQIAFDNKRGPPNSFETDWKNVKGGTNFTEFRSPYKAKKLGNRNNNSEISKKGSANKHKIAAVKRKLQIKDKGSSDIMEKHSKCFIFRNNSFCPRILKTNATSRVKNLKVYHPPRKKKGASQWKEEEAEKKSSMNTADMKAKRVVSSSLQKKKSSSNCKCKQPETSQTSSRDSAYNGGVSSLPESRSPTPDQKTKKNSCCHSKEREVYYDNVRATDENIIVPALKLTDNQDTQTEINAICGEKMGAEDICRGSDYTELITRSKLLNVGEKNCLKQCPIDDDEKDNFKRKIKEEALYTNFIRNITEEVLEKGLYTNKALKKVMKRHIVSNLWLLDKDRMLKEIDKLRTQLGIPQDEDLLDIKLNSAESFADVKDCCPITSESELVESTTRSFKVQKPEQGKDQTEVSSEMRPDTPAAKRLPKSISEILSQSRENNEISLDSESDDEDDELISVIHVSKLIRDKKKRGSFVRDMSSDQSRNPTKGNSADESEQSSDHVSRKKKLHTRHRKTEKASTSSDDIEARTCVREYRRHSNAKSDNRAESSGSPKISANKNEGVDYKSESSDKEEIESLTE